MKTMSVDTETTGLFPFLGDRPFSVQIMNEDMKGKIWRGEVNPFTRAVRWAKWKIQEIQEYLNYSSCRYVFHHAKFDLRMLASIGIRVMGRVEDTMYAMHCYNCQEPTLALKPLAKKYLDLDDEDENDLQRATIKARREGKKLGWKLADKPQGDYWMAPKEICDKYAMKDVERTILLWGILNEQMDEVGVRHTYEKEMKLLPVTMRMEDRGVRYDDKKSREEIAFHEGLVTKLGKELNKTSKGINLNSTKQLQTFLYGKKPKGLGLEVIKLTAGGSPATDMDTLNKLEHPFPRTIIKFRSHEKAVDFFHRYRRLAVKDSVVKDQADHLCLHPDYQQCHAITGRYSCRMPNLQNAADTSTGRSLEPIQTRSPFGPRLGYFWGHWDYSQLEVRIFADVSQEPLMLEAIRLGRDMHTECANKAWGGKDNEAAIKSAMHALELDGTGDGRNVLVQKVVGKLRGGTDEDKAVAWLREFKWDIVAAEKSLEKKTTRNRAKLLLFTKIFGGGIPAVSNLLECEEHVAKGFLEDYDVAFPRIGRYIDETSRLGRKQGFVLNRYGRKIMVESDKAYRGVNYIVQGSAADLLKDRMLALDEYFIQQRKKGRDVWMLLTIHDELINEIRKEHAYPWLLRRITQIMEDHGGHFGIPMPVEMAMTRWEWSKKKPFQLAP